MLEVLHSFQELEGRHFSSFGGGNGLGKNSVQKQSVSAGRRETAERLKGSYLTPGEVPPRG